MLIIKHRINTLKQLQQTSAEFGVEVDIRSYGGDLIIHHDPFVKGESFDEWIKAYKHKTLILNVKEEGLEQRLLDLMREYKIEDFFFLDQSFPFLIKTAKMGESRCAVRFSEYESIDTILSLSGKVQWVWVDCFNHFPLNQLLAERLYNADFKLCLVSPELQNRHDVAEIKQIRQIITEQHINIDAVCTKKPEMWQ